MAYTQIPTLPQYGDDWSLLGESMHQNITQLVQDVDVLMKGGAGAKSWNDLTDKPDLTVFAPKASPTFTGTVSGVTKAMVGLGNVDNTADANKSFSATQIGAGTLATARLGSGTASSTTYLAGDQTWKTMPTGGGGGTVSSLTWTQVTDKPVFSAVATTGAYGDLSGRPTIPDTSGLAPKASPTFTGTVSGITKAMVGLGNVDNTADANKSFSATQIGAGTLATARLGSGTASSATYLAGDQTWKTMPTGGGGTDVTTRQNADGSWPTIAPVANIHYRWFAHVDGSKLPTFANGARAGHELVTLAGSSVIA